MPPFKPNATVPVPAPIAPSATAPALACSIASIACRWVIVRARMSLRRAPVVLPATALWGSTHSLARRVRDRFDRVSMGDRSRADVVEAAVVGFTDDGVEGKHLFVARLRERPAHDA